MTLTINQPAAITRTKKLSAWKIGILAATTLIMAAGQANAASVIINVGAPSVMGTIDVTIGTGQTVTVTVTAAMTNTNSNASHRATLLRAAIITAVNAQYEGVGETPVASTASGGRLRFRHLGMGTLVTYTDNQTATNTQSVNAKGRGGSQKHLSFDGSYSSGDSITSGLFSDLGSFDYNFTLDEDISGQDLTLQVYNNLSFMDLASIGVTSFELDNNWIVATFDIPDFMESGVSFGSDSATGIITAGVTAGIPAPGSMALLLLGGVVASKRRRH